jgi:heat shock protein HslJ
MKHAALAAVLAALALWTAGCTVDAITVETSTSELLLVAPETVACPEQADQQCLLIRKSEEEEWQPLSGSITGFEYAPGAEYEVIVTRRATMRALVSDQGVVSFPADENEVEWELIGVMNRRAVTPAITVTAPATATVPMTATASISEVLPFTKTALVTEVAPSTETGPITTTALSTATAPAAGALPITGTTAITGAAQVTTTVPVTAAEVNPADGASATPAVEATDGVTGTGEITATVEVTAAEVAPAVEPPAAPPDTAAVTGTVTESANAELTGVVWTLASYGPLDDRRVPDGATDVTIEFVPEGEAGGTIGGESGCNRYRGAYELDGENIMITPGRTTRMLCADPGGAMQLEGAVLNALLAAEYFVREGDRLTIYYDGEQAALIFVATQE